MIAVPEAREPTVRLGDLTWPEINDAVASEKVVLIPVGSTEQHGRHLPLDVDNVIPTEVCLATAAAVPNLALVAPGIPYGYNIHAMDFPGTVHVAYDHFVEYCVDVCKSFVYHGFKRLVLVSGHGSNTPLLDFVARRIILDTDALAASLMWWDLLTIDPKFVPSVRESVFPGGTGHACEIETSAYMHLRPEKARMDRASDHIAWYNADRAGGDFIWGDAFGGGPISVFEWTSTFTGNDGVFGQATLASADKGKRLFDETVRQLTAFVEQFRKRERRPRIDHHLQKPTCPPPPA